MEAARADARSTAGQRRSGRLLALGSDEFLVRRVRAGSEAAFEALYRRHYRGVLSFCRHMLGSATEAEDAVQQTFVNALQDMLRSDKELRFKPWLYRIARNLCITALRGRRYDVDLAEVEPSLAGLSEQVATRSELRDLLRDLSQLPVEQREALVLSELHDNSHAAVAEILGCGREKVKSLVFQARSSLIKSREARDVPCAEIRRQLSVLRGGSLRRSTIRRHLKECEGCRRFDREVRHQRQALAVLLPVVPSAMLKLGASSAAAAVGLQTAAATTAAGGSAAASGSLAAVAGKLGLPVAAVKGVAATAAVTVVAAGGAVGVKATQEIVRDGGQPPAGSTKREGLPPGVDAGGTRIAPPGGSGPVGSKGRHGGRERLAPGRGKPPAGTPGALRDGRGFRRGGPFERARHGRARTEVPGTRARPHGRRGGAPPARPKRRSHAGARSGVPPTQRRRSRARQRRQTVPDLRREQRRSPPRVTTPEPEEPIPYPSEDGTLREP